MDDEGNERRPCPNCGSKVRTASAEVAISSQTNIFMLTKAKHRDGGRKVVREVTEGDSFFCKTARWSVMRRLVDWGNDWYSEIFRDKETGKILKECSEPLRDHRGHGSAKIKPLSDS
jgi:hypothetical protein